MSLCGTDDDKQLTIELLSQWKLEAEFRKNPPCGARLILDNLILKHWLELNYLEKEKEREFSISDEVHMLCEDFPGETVSSHLSM